MAKASPRTPGPIPVLNRTEPGATGSSPHDAEENGEQYPCERILWDLTPVEEGDVVAALREGSLPHKAYKRAVLQPAAHREYVVKKNPRNGGGWEPRG